MQQSHVSQVRWEMEEEETQPLVPLRGLAFRAFLEKHRLSLLDVARAAEVRLLVVWKITRDQPVSSQQARMVRTGLAVLTGTYYRGGITLYLEASGAKTHGALIPGEE
jgi:hypothetical protein